MIYERLLLLSYRIESKRVLGAIRQGLILCIPLILIGITSMMITNIPVESIQNWYLESTFGSIIYRFFASLYEVTYGAMALFLAVSMAYSYGKKLNTGDALVLTIGVVSTFICTLLAMGVAQVGFYHLHIDATGMFTGLVVGILGIRIYFYFYQLQKRVIRKHFAYVGDIYIVYEVLLPVFISILIFFTLNMLMFAITGYYSMDELIGTAIGKVFSNGANTIWTSILAMGVESLLWFFSIHGGSAIEQVMTLVFSPASQSTGMVVTRTMIDCFALMGGCGTAWSLFIALALFEKRKEKRRVLKAAFIPMLINVNEILLFGLPVVFNPILFLPFLLMPMVSISIAYMAMLIGFLPPVVADVAWTTPILISGYYTTGSIRGTIVQIIIILVGVMIYYPFVMAMQKAKEIGDSVSVERLEKRFRQQMDGDETIDLLREDGLIGMAANSLVAALKEDIANHHITMYYQPQMQRTGDIYGAEALLRWSYGGRIMFPPFVIHMAEEAGLQDELEKAIVYRVCEDIVSMKRKSRIFMKISVNISSLQLDDKEFINHIIQTAQQFGVTKNLCIEITEEHALDNLHNVSDNMKLLNEKGIIVSMDDFSMGKNSIKHLQNNDFAHVKLDGSLVTDMEHNPRSQEIISSIINLGESLDFEVVAEYVDSEKKREMLTALGCQHFQGYYYSPAIPLEEYIDYIQQYEYGMEEGY